MEQYSVSSFELNYSPTGMPAVIDLPRNPPKKERRGWYDLPAGDPPLEEIVWQFYQEGPKTIN